MFTEAIEKAANFTRPIHTISRTYANQKITPGAATLFFVNDEGYALTCKHVVELIAKADMINKQYAAFKTEYKKIPKNEPHENQLNSLLVRFKMNQQSVIQMKNTFVGCVDKMSGLTWHLHPEYDLAILKFNGFNRLLVNEFAVFKKDTSQIKQGEFLCRMGFPFPEFKNFTYNTEKDDIVWTKQGVTASPRFPIEGMVTRFLGDKRGKRYGVEMSTPGLKGQSGGPLFDKKGVVCGMQSRTKHLHLGFDIEDKEIVVKGQLKKINDYSFIHLGECIHTEVIKEFLKQHNVRYHEA